MVAKIKFCLTSLRPPSVGPESAVLLLRSYHPWTKTYLPFQPPWQKMHSTRTKQRVRSSRTRAKVWSLSTSTRIAVDRVNQGNKWYAVFACRKKNLTMPWSAPVIAVDLWVTFTHPVSKTGLTVRRSSLRGSRWRPTSGRLSSASSASSLLKIKCEAVCSPSCSSTNPMTTTWS